MNNKKPIIFAHRGASKVAPENTISAFSKAIEMGAGGIELDTHLTSDGYLVVTHDDILGRTCNGTGLVMEHDLKYLKGLDFGGWFSEDFEGERIPLLSDVFELLNERDMVLNIEIKATPGQYIKGIEDEVAKMIKSFSFVEKTIVSSFNHHVLINLKRNNPDINIAPLYGSGVFAYIGEYAKKIRASAIHPSFKTIIPDVIESCREHDIKINTWTIDDENDIIHARQMGIHGIITNVPDKALAVLKDK
jgi:glycerophosphoryl diester phosphodiesterase